ncbi:hypothetical protein QU791_25930, partial [Escherichia coli]|nr:hypothetical protein [Escherichia coli]
NTAASLPFDLVSKIRTGPVITVAVSKHRKAQKKNNCTKIARLYGIIKIQRSEKGIYLFFHNLNHTGE